MGDESCFAGGDPRKRIYKFFYFLIKSCLGKKKKSRANFVGTLIKNFHSLACGIAPVQWLTSGSQSKTGGLPFPHPPPPPNLRVGEER